LLLPEFGIAEVPLLGYAQSCDSVVLNTAEQISSRWPLPFPSGRFCAIQLIPLMVVNNDAKL
jgi:hypothetical protein